MVRAAAEEASRGWGGRRWGLWVGLSVTGCEGEARWRGRAESPGRWEPGRAAAAWRT
jgi:hypothetical protein